MTPTIIAVIGAGRIGSMHAENLIRHMPEASVRAVVDPNVDTAWLTDLGIDPALNDFDAVLADPEIEAVLVAVPSPHHVEMIQRAAEAGKQIFCEKPIAFETADIEKAVAAVKAAGVQLQVGFNRRFDPSFTSAREAVRAGRLGDILTVSVTNRDPAPPSLEFLARSGGLFLDMMIHDFDTVRSLTGTEITEVYSTGAALVDPAIAELGDIDTAVVALKLANGAVGSIVVSRQSTYGYDQRLEVLGSEGSVRVHNLRPTSTSYATEEGVVSDPLHHSFVERFHEAFVAELRAFLECVRRGTPVPVNGSDALAALRGALAAQLSLREGRPVRLAEFTEADRVGTS